ncbi:MAG: DUF1236 domain-containing protein [Rhodospirillaceae bacterium]
MKLSLTSFAAAVLISGAALAQSATTTTTTSTWTDEYGNIIRQESVTKKFEPIVDPKINVTVGAALPQSIEVHPLPSTIRVERPERYAYVILNDDPVIVEKDTRRVIHVYED